MRIKLDESAYSKHFHSVIHSWDRYIIAWGGRGSSKTDTFYLKYLISLFEPYYFKLAYINQYAGDIRDQQYAGFKRVAKRVGLFDHLRFYDGDYRIVHPKTGNMMVPKGMDDPEKTKGLDDITAIWWDECNKGKREGFMALNELLRSPQAMYLQFALSFNPVSELNWLRDTFFHKDDRFRLHPDYVGQALLHHSTYLHNDFLDKEAYLQTLLTSAAGNKNTIRVNVEGDWGQEENDSPWLHSFDEEKHVRDDIPVLPNYPVYLSFDFNNSPFACTAWQHSEHKGDSLTSFVHCVKEFTGKIKVDEMCAQIKAYFPNQILFVTGDRSGQNEDIGRNQTIYDLIAAHLSLSQRQLNLNTHNLEHADSRLFINAMLYNYPNIYISKKGCPHLISQCHSATLDLRNTAKPQQLLKNRDDHKNDEFDSMRYYFQTYFHKYAKEKYFKMIN